MKKNFLVSYSETNMNAGDVLQTIAMKDFLKRYNITNIDYIDRKNLQNGMIINGWHRNREEILPYDAIYIGMHTDINMLGNIKNNTMFGCRDEFTLNEVKKNYKLIGILSYCSSCTIPIYTGMRNGGTAYYYHEDRENGVVPFDKQIQIAYDLIDTLKMKELVYTDRLHIGLCCIAVGTPVVINRRKFQPERFSIFNTVPNFPGFGQVITLESGIRNYMERQFVYAFEKIFGDYLNSS